MDLPVPSRQTTHLMRMKEFKNILSGWIVLTASALIALDCNVYAANPVSAIPARKRPNILFILSDDHSRETIGAYNGGRLNITPNIDRIAREGMRFDGACVVSALSAPSRASILTGKHSHVNGYTQLWDFMKNKRPVFDNTQATFVTALQDAGYNTAIVGKWHLNCAPAGFDYHNVLGGEWEQGTYWSPLFIKNGKDTVYEGRYVEDVIADESIDWLKNRKETHQPFALIVTPKTPHAICEPKPEKVAKYAARIFTEPATINDDLSGHCRAAAASTQRLDEWGHYVKKAPRGLSKVQLRSFVYQRYMRDYCAAVESMDENIGRILDHLESTGEIDETIVIYASDQGMFLGDHGWYNKMFIYEEAIHIPFIIRYSKLVAPGSVSNDMVLNIDFAPTLLSLAGITPPGCMQGLDMTAILKGEKPKNWRDAFFYQHYGEWVPPHIGMRTDDYKLVYFYSPRDEQWELFDLKKDPEEMRNIFDDPAYAAIKERLLKKFEDVKREAAYTEATHEGVLARWNKRLADLDKWAKQAAHRKASDSQTTDAN